MKKETKTVEIQKIIRSKYKSLYSTKLENLDKMDNFLYIYHVPKLKQDQINHLNSPITPEEIEAVINSLPNKHSLGSDRFTATFYQIFKEDLIPILFKIFHKIETQGTIPNSFYEARFTLVPKPNKEREFQPNFPYEH